MLNNMKLGPKLGLGFGLVLIFTVAVAFAGMKGMLAVKDTVELADDVNFLVIWILEARQHEKNFIIRGEASYIATVQEKINNIYEQIRKIKERFGQTVADAQTDRLSEEVKNYENAFNEYVRLEKEKNEAEEHILSKSKEVSEKAEALIAGQKLQLDTVRSRYIESLKNRNGKAEASDAIVRHVSDMESELSEYLSMSEAANRMIRLFFSSAKNQDHFLISKDMSYRDAAKEDASRVIQLAKEITAKFQSDPNIRQGREWIIAIEAYQEAFDKFVSLTIRQSETDKKMIVHAREVQKICNEIREYRHNEMHKEIASSRWILLIGTVLGLVFSTLSAVFITRNIAGPIREVTKFAEKLNSGELSGRLPMGREINCSEILDCGMRECVCFGREAYCWVEAGSFSNYPTCLRVVEGQDCHSCEAYKKAAPNEIQKMVLALNAMAETLNTKAAIAIAIAGGDLNQHIPVTSSKDMLGTALRDMLEGLNTLIRQVQGAAVQVASASGQISDSSQSLSQCTSQQAASLEQISSSMIEIASQTRSSADNAFRASRIAEHARESAEQGTEEMAKMVSAMDDINKASLSVVRIIKIIDEIAFQTNLLALNAAVEAARAGHHGKGFAVVAGEVKNLAGRSSKAAKETAELIEGAVKKSAKGNEIAGQTADMLKKITESAVSVAELLGEIAASSGEQAQAIAQVNQGIGQIDQTTQQNTANAQETASAAEELSDQALHLQKLLEQFKLNNSDISQEKTVVAPKPKNEISPVEKPEDEIFSDDRNFRKYSM